MSFRCILRIDPNAIWAGVRSKESLLSQVSPLIFATRQEANLFARKMFETPHSVLSWKIEETDEPANYRYAEGQLRAL